MKRLIPLVFLAATCFAHAQVDLNRTIVVINGEEVKGAEYYRTMEYLPGVGKNMGSGIMELPPGLLAIDKIVTDHLVLQLAKQKGVYPSEAELKADLDLQLAGDPEFVNKWVASGRTKEELNRQRLVGIAQFKLMTNGINITNAEVQKFYQDNLITRFTIPEKAKLRIIVVDGEEAKAPVDADLKAGKKFSDVATARSIEVSKITGGDLGAITLRNLSDAVRKGLEPLKPGGTTGWIAANGTNFAKFMLEERVPAKKLELDTRLTRVIRNEMMLTRGQNKNNISKEMASLRAKVKIDIKDPQFAKAYSEYIKQYLRESGFATSGG